MVEISTCKYCRAELLRCAPRWLYIRLQQRAIKESSESLFTVRLCAVSVTHLIYTVSQKTMQLTFDINFGKCRPIFKILSLKDSQGNSLCNYCRAFHLTLTVLLHYLNLKITVAADFNGVLHVRPHNSSC